MPGTLRPPRRALPARARGTAAAGVYDLDQTTKIVPQPASALPTISDGGRTVTIKLRSGVRFADGTPMDAAPAKTSLNRDLTLPTYPAGPSVACLM